MMMMMGKPILGCAFLIMLMALAVTAYDCNCNQYKQLFKNEASCRAELNCIEASPACLNSPGARRLVDYLEKYRCKKPELCFIEIFGQLQPDALDFLGVGRDVLASKLYDRYECLRNANPGCRDTYSARNCLSSITNDQECVDILMERCVTSSPIVAAVSLQPL